ncbi:MAG: bacillithiol system redox-active protein YtxJ [Candidatus Pseudobacter hemicellulosilyticus]|uniref:Bacillithiol system redox-active protein YtxJ n=1 Tax=Candidatus Pseudobacter hemicellulosilyticus TaxID=3121375 RepID=A0AAJ5WVM2_9BACT|nr:MAG: bacillithiol system redox-active protein YtxJ [Pseudobacter sp.]
MINWINLEQAAQLDSIREQSFSRPQLIYKHSIRCGISSMVKGRLERQEAPAGIDFHYLNLIGFRAISNKIAEDFRVQHESPQVLLIKEGRCVYSASHGDIDMAAIAEQA